MSIEFKNVDYVYAPGTPFQTQGLIDISFKIEKGSFENLKNQMLVTFSHIKNYRKLKKTYKIYLNKFHKIKVHKPILNNISLKKSFKKKTKIIESLLY